MLTGDREKVVLLTSISQTVMELDELTSGGFPGGSDGKEPACNAIDVGLIPGSGRFPGEGNGNPLQYSCLENSMELHEVTKNWTQLSYFHFHLGDSWLKLTFFFLINFGK